MSHPTTGSRQQKRRSCAPRPGRSGAARTSAAGCRLLAALAALAVANCGDGISEPDRNTPPLLTVPIPPQVVEDSVAIDLSAHFTDSDGDALAFTAASSDEAVARTRVADNIATVFAGVDGSATVTVTATDPDGATATYQFGVTVPNRAPRLTATLPDIEVVVSDAVTIRASGYFTDPDQDSLTFAAESSDAAVAAVGVTGDEVTVSAMAPGVATITVTATDPDGLSVSQDFSSTVPNRAPETTGILPNIEVGVDDESVTDLSGYFSDPDGEVLTYAAVSADTTVATTSVSATDMTVSAIAKGTAAITVTAVDPGGLSVTLSFSVTVPNRAPELVDSIPGVVVEVGEAVTVEVSDHFADPDGDDLTFTAVSSNRLRASVEASGDRVRVRGLAKGTATISITATDSDGLATTQDFSATVPNRAPRATATIPDTAVNAGSRSATRMSNHFMDPDGDALVFAAESSDTAVATSEVLGSYVRVAGVSGGTATVTVSAIDPEGASATLSFLVTVPNRAPRVTDRLPDIEVESDVDFIADVSAFFMDPDDDALIFWAHSSDWAVAWVNVSEDHRLTIDALAAGAARVTVTAVDAGGRSARQSFRVTVPNRGPQVMTPIPDRRVEVDTDLVVGLWDHFTDPDGDNLGFDARSSDAAVAAVDISGPELRVRAMAKGVAVITVTATDPEGLGVSTMFDVVVPNRAPRPRGTIPDRNLNVDDEIAVGVSNLFTDPDGDALTFAAWSSNSGVAAVRVVGTEVRVNGVASGTATVTVTATDSEGLFATQSFSVTVVEQPTNRAPRPGGTIPNARLTVGDETTTNSSGYFTDPDGDELTFAANSSDPSVATASVSGDFVTVTAHAEGTATITVIATDPGGLSATQDFAVTVTEESTNRAPRPSGAIPNAHLTVGDETTTNSSGYFTDPDGDELTFAANSSDPSVTTASVSGDIVTLTAHAEGTATVTVIATDPGGLSATQDFAATVTEQGTNRAPRLNGTIPDATLTVGDELAVNVAGYFTDPDGDDLSFAASTSNAGVATAGSYGSVATVGAVSLGAAAITVTATDPGGLSATQSFRVTVEERVVDTGFDIALYYDDNVRDAYRPTIESAAALVESILADNALWDWDAPIDGEFTCRGTSHDLGTVDDVAIFVRSPVMDGSGGGLAAAAVCLAREATYHPIVGAIRFDRADIGDLHAKGILHEVAVHEFLHVMGIGINFGALGLAVGNADRHFTGRRAIAAFNAAGGTDYQGSKVPTDIYWHHWREGVLNSELMTPSIERDNVMPLSAITIQALADLGYIVDLSLAEDYELPTSGPQPDTDAEGVLHLGDDIDRGPVMIIDRDGNIVRVIPGR